MSCVKFILKHYILKLKNNNIHNFITLKAFFFFDGRILKALWHYKKTYILICDRTNFCSGSYICLAQL
jgi:hypothetical protein